jgi:hypothetical protein
LPSGEEIINFEIFTVAYGDDADKNILSKLANKTGGKMYEADIKNISKIYFNISTEF